VAVFAGLTFLVIGGAPDYFVFANSVTLLAVMLLVWMIPSVFAVRTFTIVAVIIAILMALSLVSNMAIDGVQRWLPLGPLRLHAGMLLIPTLVVIVQKVDHRLASAVLISVAVVIALQPDFASAMALALSTIVMALSLRSKWMVIAAVIALGSLAFTKFNMVELPPVRFVEEVVPAAWLVHPLLAVALITSLATAIVWPIRSWGFSEIRRSHRSHRAFGVFRLYCWLCGCFGCGILSGPAFGIWHFGDNRIWFGRDIFYRATDLPIPWRSQIGVSDEQSKFDQRTNGA